jgi:hypothetical protein
LHELYVRLDVGSAMEAAVKLGWVHLPEVGGPFLCGWVGYCSRPAAHRGHHGGMRALPNRIFIDEQSDGESGREAEPSVI